MPLFSDTQAIALLIDAENASARTLPAILDELSKHGTVLARNAYGDWSKPSLSKWPVVLDSLAIRPVQNFVSTSGKNASDIALVIDAMDMFHGEAFDAFAIVSSDGDFAGLASRLRRGGRYVFGFGEEKTPVSLRNACDDFQRTDLLAPKPESEAPTAKADNDARPQPTLEQIQTLLLEAADSYGDADGWTDLAAAGALLKRQRPDFQYQAFGCNSFMGLLKQMKTRFETRTIERGAGTAAQYRAVTNGTRKAK
jgi:hypothetical protein